MSGSPRPTAVVSNLPTGGDVLLMRRIWPLRTSEGVTVPFGRQGGLEGGNEEKTTKCHSAQAVCPATLNIIQTTPKAFWRLRSCRWPETCRPNQLGGLGIERLPWEWEVVGSIPWNGVNAEDKFTSFKCVETNNQFGFKHNTHKNQSYFLYAPVKTNSGRGQWRHCTSTSASPDGGGRAPPFP